VPLALCVQAWPKVTKALVFHLRCSVLRLSRSHIYAIVRKHQRIRLFAWFLSLRVCMYVGDDTEASLWMHTHGRIALHILEHICTCIYAHAYMHMHTRLGGADDWP
jgi:hypothetical protein